MKNVFKTAVSAMMAAAMSNVCAAAVQVQDDPRHPHSTIEVLAHAPYRDGDGSIEILRVTEDGVDSIGIKREAKIGTSYAPRPEWARLPLSEQVALVFEDLSGRQLPENAVDALLKLEALRAERKQGSQIATAPASSKGGAGKPLCPVATGFKSFIYDCVVRNAISKQGSPLDDVCLLTAAIEGNHTQEISYELAGKFYETHEANVYEDHYVAYQHLTGTLRTRKGHIFNASSSDKHRYNFMGDGNLIDGVIILVPGQCNTVVG